jgi:hypothetical protein
MADAIEYQIWLKGWPYTNFWPWDRGKFVLQDTIARKEEAQWSAEYHAQRGIQVKVVINHYDPDLRKKAEDSRIQWVEDEK